MPPRARSCLFSFSLCALSPSIRFRFLFSLSLSLSFVSVSFTLPVSLKGCLLCVGQGYRLRRRRIADFLPSSTPYRIDDFVLSIVLCRGNSSLSPCPVLVVYDPTTLSIRPCVSMSLYLRGAALSRLWLWLCLCLHLSLASYFMGVLRSDDVPTHLPLMECLSNYLFSLRACVSLV